uniref:RNA helicase n=1 Tax=Anopheles farauti TaxID=69004 RepID=A0A182Q4Z5_9DIPT
MIRLVKRQSKDQNKDTMGSTTRCVSNWCETSINVPRCRKPISLPKPIFRLTVEYNAWCSGLVVHLQNLCQQNLILRSIFLYYETNKRVALFEDVVRMVPGYEFAMEKTIQPKEDGSYHLVLLGHVLGTTYKLRETVLIQLLSPRKARGLPAKLKKLPFFEVPDYVKEVFVNSFLPNPHYNRNAQLWLQQLQQYQRECLNHVNYVDYLRKLNQVEEYASFLVMSEYTIEDARLKEVLPMEYLLTIDQFKVPPVLLDVGCHVNVHGGVVKTHQKKTVVFTRGIIIKREVSIVIKTEVPLQKLYSLKVEFPLNRTQFHMEYMALNNISHLMLECVLFPSADNSSSVPEQVKRIFKNNETFTSFEWFQKQIGKNKQQKLAIQNIVNRTSYPAPYILFGPPGTGKTYTIVEAILQIWKLRPKSRILVTATSNFACNELTSRLLKFVPPDDIFRYFSLTTERDINGMDMKVIEVSNMFKGFFETPTKQDFYQTRILVCTVMNSARMLQLNIIASIYDYIFIDECGSSKELSALVPIGCIGTDPIQKKVQASIILAGDPKQLGPVTRFQFLRETPHDLSLLERLMAMPAYRKDPLSNEYNTRMVTKLLDNYRSHAALFEFSNQQFYEGELRAKGAPEVTNWALNWERLPNPKFPMLFHSINGFMQQDAVSLSYWNGDEAERVFEYVQMLIKAGVNGRIVQQEDIGIVTPYSKQVEYIKNGLSALGFDKIEIGSAEQYQGREKPVIIVSTVRSNRRTVGFLADWRRLNVLLTRAQALTIIVGNPGNLKQDQTWYQLLNVSRALSENMESCAVVEKEVEKVINKFSAINDHSQRIIGDVISLIEKLRSSIAEGNPDNKVTAGQVDVLNEALTKTKDKLHRLTTEHRDLHGTVSKVGKAIDRSFVADFTATSRTDVFQTERNVMLLNRIMAQHFYRQGMDDVADALIKESGLPAEDIVPEPYAELHRIWEAIHTGNLAPALEWASRYSAELDARNSTLEFKLHRLAFMQILNGGVQAQTEAIAYARTNFAKFVRRFEKDIQILMGTLIYLQIGIHNSPYKYLTAPEMWIETADVFLKDACQLLGINKDSPLSMIVNAGCTALPALLNLKQVMMSRQVTGIWNGRDELPIEIDLEPENRFHSIFACPILRQQSSEDNPPMKLLCGHVISRDALNKLSNEPIMNNTFRLKCPYCPMEQCPSDAKLIYF